MHIDSEVDLGEEDRIRLSLFYGHPSTNQRHISWDLLRSLRHQSDMPWIVFGDFNEVCFPWEVRGSRVRGEWQMRAFREAMFDCGLTDIAIKGSPFTFSNKR
ncbi:hypothetical protein QQ045_017340 [Rhodiola kirilowii]